LHPQTRVYALIVRGNKYTSYKLLEVVAVGMGLNIDFAEFFADNNVDPVTISPDYQHLVPPNYAADYDPNKIVKEDPFVRNMAAVLQINPERIKVVNIVPGNRRRRVLRRMRALGLHEDDYDLHQHRFLDGDEGLDLDFEISENDPCAAVDCGDEGVCKNGNCVCNDGWHTVGAYSYNITTAEDEELIIRVNASDTCAVNETAWQKLFNATGEDGESIIVVEEEEVEEVEEAEEGEGAGEEGAEGVDAAQAAEDAAAAQSAFNELVNVAASLGDAAETGNLDLGYEVLAMEVVIPEDVCGVPGGNGTTCDDACGVPVGDNSTCADVCGIPNGDGQSCLVEPTTYFECGTTEKIEVRVQADLSIAGNGLYTMVFNGEETGEISVLAGLSDIQAALSGLSSTGEFAVSGLIGDEYTE
jgi:hypothetical protein